MAATPIVTGLDANPVGPVNTFLLESSAGCMLIDFGLPGSADKIIDTMGKLGKQPKDSTFYWPRSSGPHRQFCGAHVWWRMLGD